MVRSRGSVTVRFHPGPLSDIAWPAADKQGWVPTWQPADPLRFELLLLPPSFLAVALLCAAFVVAWPSGADVRHAAVGVLAVQVALIPVHELLHAFATPGFGLTDQTVIIVQPSRLKFACAWLGEIGRVRRAVVAAAPFLGLTVLPSVLVLSGAVASLPLAALAALNLLASSKDLVNVFLIFWEVPAGGVLLQEPGGVWWRPGTSPG